MKITEQSESKIVINDSPIVVSLLCIVFVAVGLLLKFYPNIFEQSPPPIFSQFLIVGGIIVGLSLSTYSTIVFDKPKNQLRVSRYGLVGLGTKTYDLNSITQVHYQLRSYGNASNRPGRIDIHFSDGTKVPLTIQSGSDPSNHKRRIGQQIAQFLNVQYIQDTISEEGSTFYD